MKHILKLLICIFIIGFILLALYNSRTQRIEYLSPDGQYSITADWIDLGGFGYRGRIYLKENNSLIKKYFTGEYVPASYGWLSDTEFYITDRNSGKKIFNINDFVNSKE